MKNNGLTLGVLGGMGPAAAAEFLKILAEKSPAVTDQEHPRMFLYSLTSIPDRTSYILGKGEDPSPAIRKGLDTLVDWGADILAVTCNTAHYYIDQWRDELSKPLVHIIDETIKCAQKRSPRGTWLVGTLGTIRTGLFQRHAEAFGYNCLVPPEDMLEKIHNAIELVKENRADEAGVCVKKEIERLWEMENIPVIAACTEVPIAYAHSGLPLDMEISSLDALAEGCIRELYKKL